MKFNPDNIRRILVIRWGSMGDVVRATAVIQDICDAFPGRLVDLSTERPWHKLFNNDFRFNEIITLQVRGKKRMANGIKWLNAVASRKYDLIIDLQGNDHSCILLSLLRIFIDQHVIITGTRPRFPCHLHPPPYDRKNPALICLRGALEALGIRAVTEYPVLYAGPDNKMNVAGLLSANGMEQGRYALFAPGSSQSGVNRRWPAENYITLANQLAGSLVDKIFLLGTSVDSDVCQYITEKSAGHVINLCEQTEILDLLPLAESSALIIGNDTGIMHIAAASHNPCIVLFGCSDSRHSTPLGRNVIAIQADSHLLERGIVPEPESINRLQPSRVMEQITLIMNSAR